eukprot:scaffold1306_cov399-Prasinococcus_capsulatus_cf.AAC.4
MSLIPNGGLPTTQVTRPRACSRVPARTGAIAGGNELGACTYEACGKRPPPPLSARATTSQGHESGITHRHGGAQPAPRAGCPPRGCRSAKRERGAEREAGGVMVMDG